MFVCLFVRACVLNWRVPQQKIGMSHIFVNELDTRWISNEELQKNHLRSKIAFNRQTYKLNSIYSYVSDYFASSSYN